MKSPPRSRPKGEAAGRRRPLVVRLIARLNVGGPAKHVVWLNDGLRADFDCVLVTGTVPPGEQDMGYFAAGRRVRRIVVPELSREIHLRDLVVIFKIFRILLRLRPDLVHTHTAKAGTVGRVAGLLYRLTQLLPGKKRRCLLVHTYHGHVFHGYYGALKSRLFVAIERILARIATDRIVVISPQQLREIHGVYKVGRAEQFEVVPLGIDLDPFEHMVGGNFRSSLGIASDKIVIGTIGRLTEVKNHELFIRAADRFNRQNPSLREKVTFVIIGEGPLRQRLEEMSTQLGLTNLIFAGMHQDPTEFYPALDLVALTSRNEGTPLTLIEAMAAGVPVVATEAGGVVDLLGAKPIVESASKGQYLACERGVLVSVQNETAFADALAFALGSPEILAGMAARARQFVQARYSRQRLINDISCMYNALLTGEESRPESVASGSTTATG